MSGLVDFGPARSGTDEETSGRISYSKELVIDLLQEKVIPKMQSKLCGINPKKDKEIHNRGTFLRDLNLENSYEIQEPKLRIPGTR